MFAALRRRLLAALERWLLRLWYGGARPVDKLLALLAAPLALPLSGLVAALARRRSQQIRHQAPDAHPPVLVVGNLVAGGAGKTPAVIALARGLSARGHRVGLLARGYQAPESAGATTAAASDSVQLIGPDSEAAQAGDEPLLLAQATGCPVAVGSNRAAALALLLQVHPELSLVISDDGLQHTGLARAAELLLIDERGFGNGHCLPAGPLREPVARLATVDAVLLHRRDALPAGAPAPRALYQLRTGFSGFRALGGPQRWTPAQWRERVQASGQPLLAVAGIARPDRFFDDLRSLGLEIEPHPLPDHATIDPIWLAAQGPRLIAITAKDAVKLSDPALTAASGATASASPGTPPLVVVADQGGELDEALLNWLISRWPGPSGPG